MNNYAAPEINPKHVCKVTTRTIMRDLDWVNGILQYIRLHAHVENYLENAVVCVMYARWTHTCTYIVLHASGMGIFWLLPEFWLFEGPRGHYWDSFKFDAKIVYVYVTSNGLGHIASTSYNPMHHFIPRWSIRVWLGVGLFGNTAQEVAILKFVCKCNVGSLGSEMM